MKSSPYDDNIVACGSNRGLITIVNVVDKVLLHRLRAHDSFVTCIDWMQLTFDSTIVVETKREKPLKAVSARAITKEALLRGPPKTVVDADDAFDIYDFDDGADEFGVIARATYATDADPKRKALNENGNYVEECQNLVKDILHVAEVSHEDICTQSPPIDSPAMEDSLIANDFEKLSMSTIDLTPTDKSHKLPANNSNEHISTITLDHSSDESFVHVNDSPKKPANKKVYLATGARDGAIWLWEAETGSLKHTIKFNTSTKNSPLKGLYIVFKHRSV